MHRKWMILGVTMVSVAVLTTGLSLAADEDEGPLHKLMEQVNAKSTAIKKAVRTPVAFKKAQANQELATNAEALIILAKEGRGLGKEAAKKVKNEKDPETKWVALMDAFSQHCEKFAEVVRKSNTTQAQAKSEYGVLTRSCTNCHNVFRVEDEDTF